MASGKDCKAGFSGNQLEVEDTLEESFGLASERFDPIHVLYTSTVDLNEDVETYTSVSQFMDIVDIEDPPRPHDPKKKSHSSLGKGESKRLVGQGRGFTKSTPVPGCDETASSACGLKNQIDVKPVGQNIDEASGSAAAVITLTDVDQSVKHTCYSTVGETVNKTNMATSFQGLTFVDDSLKPTDLDMAVESAQSSRFCKQPKSKSSTTLPMHRDQSVIKEENLFIRKRKTRKTIITEMDCGFQEGPLSILRRSVEERIKVRVWTRSVRNIRGVSTGYVVAFDKHMNLAMMDVDEVYRKPLGKHQRKKKKRQEEADPPVKDSESKEETEASYPQIPWQPTNGQTLVGGATSLSKSRDRATKGAPAGSVDHLASQFRGMHMFEENESSRLLGVKCRKLLTRHLNQVLLRGDHVVAVSLVELDV